jgi:hypothetical protein
MENNNTSRGGVSIGTVVLIVFIILKLCGVINWPWIWVLSPLWIGLILTVILIIIAVIIKIRT